MTEPLDPARMLEPADPDACPPSPAHLRNLARIDRAIDEYRAHGAKVLADGYGALPDLVKGLTDAVRSLSYKDRMRIEEEAARERDRTKNWILRVWGHGRRVHRRHRKNLA